MAPLKVYVASATANPETKYRVQRTLMILDGLGIPFDSIDITKPEKAEDRRFMRENARKDDRSQVLPPQFFYNDEYLGDYEDFDASVEEDTIAQFLRLLPDTIESNVDNESTVNQEETSKNNVDSENGTKSSAKGEGEDEDDEEYDEDEEYEDEDEQEDEEEGTSKKEEKVDKTVADEEVVESATISLPKPSEDKKAEEEAGEAEVDDEELEGEDEEWDEDEEEIEE